ncbi:hypothetical protein [Candidatus Poriferisocius sp.]|uniref:hypothetical protein n=1 Tax=Candidatus Poriferisocius sp. TaxID=3101276 RepID=UPI003B02E405
MSDAIAFLLVLPVMVLGLVVLNAAGTLGAANYRTSIFAETAAVYAADALAGSNASHLQPSARPRWSEVVATVEQSGLAATAGVCNQTGTGFNVSVVSQPRASDRSGDLASVAVVAGCPVELGNLLVTGRAVAVAVEPVG